MWQSSGHACSCLRVSVMQGESPVEGERSNKGGLSQTPNSLHQQGLCGRPLLPLAHGGEGNEWRSCKDMCLHLSYYRHGHLWPHIKGEGIQRQVTRMCTTAPCVHASCMPAMLVCFPDGASASCLAIALNKKFERHGHHVCEASKDV